MSREEWIKSTLDLADELAHSSEGNRAENLEKAIFLYESVLRALPHRGTRELRATVENGLANIVAERISGNRIDNVERSIAGYKRALRLVRRDQDPLKWAELMANLAATHIQRLKGDRSENLEKAIAGFKQVAGILTSEGSPFEWAQLMNNLGSAHLARIAGDRLSNLEEALSCFTHALAIQTRKAAPLERASTLENMATTYLERIVGARTDNLHCALKHAAEAAAILAGHRLRNRHAEVVLLMAAALFLLCDVEKGSLEKSIRAYRRSLRILTREANPLPWARAQINLGIAYEERAHRDYGRSLSKALKAFGLAMTVYRREIMPHKHAFVQRNLGSLWFQRGHWADAFVAYSRALEVDESLLIGVKSLAFRQDFLRKNRVALPRAAYCLARLDNLAEAVLMLEGGRTRNLSQLLGRGRTTPRISDASREKALRVVANRLNCPLVYLAATSAGCFAIYVFPGKPSRENYQALWLDSFDLDRLHQHVYVQNYSPACLAGNDQMVKSILDLAWRSWQNDISIPVARRLSEFGYRRALLIPTGLLGLLPLASAAVDSATFATVPSARVLRSVLSEATKRASFSPVLCGIANPISGAPSLAFSVKELSEIGALFGPGDHRLLVGDNAHRNALRTALAGATHLHIACHSQFQSLDIESSTFHLAGQETMEIREFWQRPMDFSRCRLAVLSACSSGIPESRDQPDEVLGLPAALLQSGVPNVLSCLWPVADASTALLMIRFYNEHLTFGRSPAEALAAAQIWLRESTVADLSLECLYEEIYRENPDPKLRANAFRKLRFYRNKPHLRPFEHPFYWAGFSISGVGFDLPSASTTRASGSANSV